MIINSKKQKVSAGSIDSQNLPKISHILGIDFGTAKIGLALADTEMKMAFIYQNIANDKKMLENLTRNY